MRKKSRVFAAILAACMSLSLVFSSTALAAQEEPSADPEAALLEEVPEETIGEAPALEEPAGQEPVPEANPEAEAELAAADLPYFAGEIIVVFEQGANAQACADENASEVQALNTIPGVGDVALVSIPKNQTVAQAIAVYNGKPGVRYAEPNYRYYAYEAEPDEETPVDMSLIMDEPSAQAQAVNDPMATQQWYREKIGVDTTTSIIDALPPRDKVLVAVVDTMADLNHPDLKNIYNKELSKDFTNGKIEPYPDTSDGEEHATHVSGIIAAEANNGIGIAGVASGSRNQVVELMSCRVLGVNGGSSYNVALGVAWAGKCGADVVNMSLGGEPAYPPAGDIRLQEEVIDSVVEGGTIVVCAAGNSDTDAYSTPSDFDSVISVIATTDYKDPLARCKTTFSNFGKTKDISAPGERILSSIPDGKYEYFDGTSMAAPVVAGVAAMMRYAKPGISPMEVKKGIESTATDLFRPGFDTTTAWGNVNAEAAVKYALKENPTPEPPTPSVAVSPRDLKAVEVTPTSVKLQWTDVQDKNEFEISKYVVRRSEAKYKSISDAYETLAIIDAARGKLTYVDTELVAGKNYHYMVFSYSKYQDLTYPGNAITVTTKCGKPATFTAAGHDKATINLKWSAVSGADGYYLYRSTSKTGGYKREATFAGGEEVNYFDRYLKAGTKYYYKLIAFTNTENGVVKGETAGPVAGLTKSR